MHGSMMQGPSAVSICNYGRRAAVHTACCHDCCHHYIARDAGQMREYAGLLCHLMCITAKHEHELMVLRQTGQSGVANQWHVYAG